MTRESPGPRAHDISGPGDRYEALMEVLEHQAAQAADDRAREAEDLLRQQEEGSRVPYWLVGMVFVFTAWLWIFPPSFLSLESPPPQPLAQEEAALRFAMYLQAQRLRAYEMETGVYPEALEEAGPPHPNMRYVLLTDGLYQLTGVTDRLTLTYRSDLPLAEFVGSGAEVLDVGGS